MASTAALVAGLALAAPNAADGLAHQQEDVRRSGRSGRDLEHVGSVIVTGWNRNEVDVTGELGEGAERLEFTTAMSRASRSCCPRGPTRDDTDLDRQSARAAALSVNIVSADISVQGVRGAQRLQSVSGDIATEAAGEDVECKTVSGDVTVTGSGRRA